MLDVARDASVADLRRAHEKIVRETAPDALDPGLARELAAQIDAIRTVAAEALRVLSDDESPSALRQPHAEMTAAT